MAICIILLFVFNSETLLPPFQSKGAFSARSPRPPRLRWPRRLRAARPRCGTTTKASRAVRPPRGVRPRRLRRRAPRPAAAQVSACGAARPSRRAARAVRRAARSNLAQRLERGVYSCRQRGGQRNDAVVSVPASLRRTPGANTATCRRQAPSLARHAKRSADLPARRGDPQRSFGAENQHEGACALECRAVLAARRAARNGH